MGTRVSIHSSSVYIYLSTSLSIYIDLFGREDIFAGELGSTTQISAGFLNLNVLAKTHAGEMVEHMAELNVLSSSSGLG